METKEAYRLEIYHEVGGYRLHSGPAITWDMAKSLLDYQRKFNRQRARIVRNRDGAVIEEYIP